MSESSASPAAPKNGQFLRRLLKYVRRIYHALSQRIISITGLPPSEVRTHIVQATIAVIVTALLSATYLGVSGVFSIVSGTLPFVGEDHSSAIDNQSPSQVTDAGLQLVDVSYVETSTFPQIDVKMRNTSSEVAFIKRADIHVKEVWTLEWYSAGGGAPITGNYDVELPIIALPEPLSVSISQVVDPNGVDRFTFTVTPYGGLKDPFTDYIYLLSIDLIYDEDDKIVSSDDLLYMISFPGKPNPFANYNPENAKGSQVPAYVSGPITTNAYLIDSISEVPAKRNDRLQEAIDSVGDL